MNNRRLIENSLVKVNGHFEIDFEQLERDIVENDVKLYVFCSPHNPGGRVWTKEELTKVADLCQKHGVLLVSDEIHQDLALYGNKHISMNTIQMLTRTLPWCLVRLLKPLILLVPKQFYYH